MSKADIGRETELLAIKLLEGQGYHVHRVVRNTYRIGTEVRSNGIDVFGSVDIVAKAALDVPGLEARTRWIQVLKGRNVGEKKKSLALTPWNKAHDSVEIWRYVDGSGKRKDGRNSAVRPRMFFQVYHFDDEYKRDKSQRIFVTEVTP